MKIKLSELKKIIHEELITEAQEAAVTMEDLASIAPIAYNNLPQAYQEDPEALQFYMDVNDNLIAVHELHGDESQWSPELEEWVDIPVGG